MTGTTFLRTFHPPIRRWSLPCALAFVLVTAPSLVPAAPPSGGSSPVPVSLVEAEAVVRDLFGLETGEAVKDERGFRFKVTKMAGGRRCPLEKVRDTRCGDFAWAPSEARVFHHSVVAPLSGHLSRNRVVVVDLFSSSAGVAFSALHGVLVFPGPAVKPAARPAFAWYLTRLGRSVSLDLSDVTGDGLMDILYGYSQQMGGGIHVVARDIWTVARLAPEKLLSAGEKLSGVFLSTFDGAPLHDDGLGTLGRGALRTVATAPDRPDLVVLERARMAGPGTAWEMHVLTDFGEGWTEHLTGAPGSPESWGIEVEVDGEPGPDCTPVEVPAGLSIKARRGLLELETACRVARAPFLAEGVEGADAPLLKAFRMLWAAVSMHVAGYHVIALALEESASMTLTAGWPFTWPVSVGLSLHAAWLAQGEYHRAFDPRFAQTQGTFVESLTSYPALYPVTWPLDRLERALRAPSKPGELRLTAPGN